MKPDSAQKWVALIGGVLAIAGVVYAVATGVARASDLKAVANDVGDLKTRQAVTDTVVDEIKAFRSEVADRDERSESRLQRLEDKVDRLLERHGR